MELIPAKTILSVNRHPQWFGADYNMNIYRGCNHGCVYCDSRSECYRVEDFHRVRAKRDAVSLLDAELGRKRKKGVVMTGSMSDPYNPREETHRLTRAALEAIHRRGFGVAIATKSGLVTRDADILARIAESMPVLVKMTVTTADDALAAKLESGAPPPSRRFAAIRLLAGAGLFSGVLLMPVLPFLTDSEQNILRILDLAVDAGARFVYAGLGVTLRDRQRDWFYGELDRLFPGLSARYRSAFKERYQCPAQEARSLYAVFERGCAERGLLCHMPDIIRAYRSAYDECQLSFFPEI